MVLAFALALGQSSTSAPTVQVATSKTYGTYLVDGNGQSLYVLSSDSKDTSTCSGACAQAWPPLAVTGTPTAASGVAASLLGTIKRQDGTLQVTYNGLPLYTFVKDKASGDTNGEGVNAHGGEWDLVSPYGESIKPPAPGQQQHGERQAADGVERQRHGAVEPARRGPTDLRQHLLGLSRSQWRRRQGAEIRRERQAENTEMVVRQIFYGGHFMPPFGKALSKDQIAGAATYVRTSWGNDYGAVTAKEVSQILSK